MSRHPQCICPSPPRGSSNPSGQYFPHDENCPFWRSVVAEVGAAPPAARRRAEKRVHLFRCDGCQAAYAFTAEQLPDDPVVSPCCGEGVELEYLGTLSDVLEGA